MEIKIDKAAFPGTEQANTRMWQWISAIIDALLGRSHKPRDPHFAQVLPALETCNFATRLEMRTAVSPSGYAVECRVYDDTCHKREIDSFVLNFDYEGNLTHKSQIQG